MREIAAVLLVLSFASAHGMGVSGADNWAILKIPNPLDVIIVASIISGLAIFYSIFIKTVSENAKKIAFAFISIPILLATVYTVGAEIYLDQQSATGGPVHWHADYEVWACGTEYALVHSKGLSDDVGTDTVHTHNDKRIHVEGILMSMEQASLGSYFAAVGGQFSGDSLTFRTDNGTYAWKNGDLCNGKSAQWYVFVNGRRIENPDDYVISPYTLVPPGDQIKMIFAEKSPMELNKTIGGPP